jgi:hypothetical protein
VPDPPRWPSYSLRESGHEQRAPQQLRWRAPSTAAARSSRTATRQFSRIRKGEAVQPELTAGVTLAGGADAFAAMDPSETPGSRVSVDTGELKVDREL